MIDDKFKIKAVNPFNGNEYTDANALLLCAKDAAVPAALDAYVKKCLSLGCESNHIKELRALQQRVLDFQKVQGNRAPDTLEGETKLPPNATDCLFMFGAWLTSLEEPITFSSKHDASPMVQMLERFISENNLPDVSADYLDNLKQPPALGGTAAPTLVELFGNWLQSDNGTAWGWHCQLACALMDEGVNHAKANERARQLMKHLFGCWDYYTEFYKEAEFKLEPGNYYWVTSEHGDRTLVYYYMNPDAERLGFGFNIADGSGFVPATDFTYASIEAF